jgi:putative ATP-binding cassette transporter
VAIARALLAKPDWLFLDEATTGMDEAMEAKIYQALVKHLPQTAIISIGHRGTLQQFHTRRLEMQPTGTGPFTTLDPAAQAAE